MRHFGALAHFRAARSAGEAAAGPRLDGDFSLNVTNALTARWLLAQGLASLTPAYDLDEDQLLALLEHAPAERFVVPLYHRIPTFHTEHCTYAHLLSEGRDFLHDAPWMVLGPGIAVLLTSVGINLLGDFLRDVYDPRLQRL